MAGAMGNPKFTTSMNKKYLYGTPEEVDHRLGIGYPNTESHFVQRATTRSSPGSGNLNDRTPGKKSNEARV